MGFITVPGFVKKWKYKVNEDGLFVSEVERVEDEEERKRITRLLRSRHPGFSEVVFP
jgi:Cys-tRNA synthase (O-phospho-L-seryl-tRNA:Cys-tRNA synthase)